LLLLVFHVNRYKGLSYVISFAIGSSLVTVLFWAIRLAVQTKREGSFTAACQKLPSFHWRKMLLPGIISGVLYSIGNVGSILSVTYLGEGIGMSMVQSCMIVSGVWGIFWFQEIQNMVSIVCWFVSAGITVWSILFLAHEETGIPVVPTPQHTSFSLSS
jgi:glucose uptake protein GlcU